MANLRIAETPKQLLTADERQLLGEYRDVVTRLRQAGIVRSGNVTGDIGEWLMVRRYGLELVPSCRNAGFEGYIELDGQRHRAQVKVHNAAIGTNRNVGNPDHYDVLLILVGPDSVLRDARVIEGGESAYHVYVFEPAEIAAAMHRYSDGSYSCGKTVLHREKPFDIIPF